jgi:enolase-phosphatase E1
VPAADESETHVILLDIEGTTTPVDFVTKTLFPYASRKVESFIREHTADLETQALLKDLHAQWEADQRQRLHPPAWSDESEESRLQSAAEYAKWLIARDSKCTPLKTLQGKMWQEGYARGELRGEVYPDVPKAFARWRAQQKKICIYSSGSELAQRLLFGSVASGDLTHYIEAFFDTRVGRKAERGSYSKIAASVGHPAAEFLFISDAENEIDAAKRAGMLAALCLRGTMAKAAGADQVIRSFDEIFPE